jgi:HSP20 family protein
MSTITRWNPVREMITLREAMDQLVNDQYVRTQDYSRQSVAWQLPVDAYANEDAIVITADVPGLKIEDLHVTLESNTLTIRGELKNRMEGRDYFLRERATSHFEPS